MSNGIIRAQVEKNKDFIIQTSVSVASVKGTAFWVISDKKIGEYYEPITLKAASKKGISYKFPK